MSTARQVVDPSFINPARATGSPERAVINRPSLRPRIPLQFWWGNASSSLVSGAPKASAPANPSSPSGSSSPSSSSGGCCG